MFDLIPKFLSSIASFLFPLFASYKALKTSDPTQLTPWLMYWSVLSCALLAESWLEFILWWIPFYSYLRLFFLLYLVLPQTQGARYLYETYLHPYLEENETQIEDFIASAHDRLRTAGMAYLRQAIELVKTKMLGMPPSEPSAEEVRAKSAPQGYTQALLARFSVPATRWASQGTGNAGTEFYNLLASAVSAATGASALASAGGFSSGGTRGVQGAGAADISSSGTLIPDNIRGSQEKMSFIASQRERLAFVLNALDREAKALQERQDDDRRPGSLSLDGADNNGHNNAGSGLERPPSGHSVWSALSKSRSEVDFEKIEAESASEEDENGLRRRAEASTPGSTGGRAGWSFLGWGTTMGGSTGAATPSNDSPTRGKSSGVDQP
ncbi:Receptor expression-enhancing protein 2 [Apiospora phragmitis]|uniref:Protein YOP1 n=1 Tax=Apiospora phragmitis TaxID=2905665 RepID=A0ABR1VHL9_9PEZI